MTPQQTIDAARIAHIAPSDLEPSSRRRLCRGSAKPRSNPAPSHHGLRLSRLRPARRSGRAHADRCQPGKSAFHRTGTRGSSWRFTLGQPNARSSDCESRTMGRFSKNLCDSLPEYLPRPIYRVCLQGRVGTKGPSHVPARERDHTARTSAKMKTPLCSQTFRCGEATQSRSGQSLGVAGLAGVKVLAQSLQD